MVLKTPQFYQPVWCGKVPLRSYLLMHLKVYTKALFLFSTAAEVLISFHYLLFLNGKESFRLYPTLLPLIKEENSAEQTSFGMKNYSRILPTVNRHWWIILYNVTIQKGEPLL